MDSNQNTILNSSQFQKPLPLNPNRAILPRTLPVLSSEEEVLQSFKMKKNVLLQALNAKKNGNTREYYSLLNRQSFINSKEESQALRIWVKVFLESITIIIHEFQDHELLELLVFKLPWFISTTTHGQNFASYVRLALAVFPHEISYIHKVIKHIFSPHGLYQCLASGEHRPSLSDVLWTQAQTLIRNFEDQGQPATVEPTMTENSSAKTRITQEQIDQLNKIIKEVRTVEDILVRAKQILKKYSELNPEGQVIVKVTDLVDQLYLKLLFSYHPTRVVPEDPHYPILVGKCHGQQTFFVRTVVLSEEALPDEDDAISAKKCVNAISHFYSQKLREFAENKFQKTQVKKIGQFLAKIMKSYPSAQTAVMQNLLEKLPHKNQPMENHYQYYKMMLEIARYCPETEEKILEGIVERLCQLDVDIKSKIRKFHFSDLKKIQQVSCYLRELVVKVPSEKEQKMGILFDLLLEYINERATNVGKDQKNFDDFIESLMKIFENKIFAINKLNFMQYLPIYVMSLASVNDKCRLFGEKFISFLIFKAFNVLSKEHLSVRQQAWNYLSSLIARENGLIRENTLVKSLNFITKFFSSNCKNQNKTVRADRSPSQGSTDASSDMSDGEQATQDKIFTHCFIQGLVLILTSKSDLIQRNDPSLFTTICKFIFKKHIKSLVYCSPIILADLVNLIQSNKHGLSVFKKKIYEQFFLRQNDELKTSKRLVYNKVQKFMAFECPLYIYPVSDKLCSQMLYDDVSTKMHSNSQDTISSNTLTEKSDANQEVMQDCDDIIILPPPQNNKYVIAHDEIDFPSSSQEEDKKQSNASIKQSILYEPELSNDETPMATINSKVDLSQAIAQSRHTEAVFKMSSSFVQSFEITKFDEAKPFVQISAQSSFSKLNMNSLNELNNAASVQSFSVQAQQSAADDYEVISSSRETEYSISPQQRQVRFAEESVGAHMMSDKSKKKRNIQRQKRNLTMSLKEENDRAEQQRVIQLNRTMTQ